MPLLAMQAKAGTPQRQVVFEDVNCANRQLWQGVARLPLCTDPARQALMAVLGSTWTRGCSNKALDMSVFDELCVRA
jgi:hypothetical protein